MEEKVFSYIEKYRMIETGSQVIAGISGGADSVCLLFLLNEYRKKVDFELLGVHVNHQIRGEEAHSDEKFSQDFCRRLQIPFEAYSFPVKEIAAKNRISVEEAGRNVRRRAFFQAAENRNLQHRVVALAHHENDNAETVIHHLVRGTGAAGLGGIHPIQKEERGVYIRPLLCVSRKEIEEYLKEKGIGWVTDSTNLEDAYTRNKIRLKVVPELEKINQKAVAHIAQTAKRMRLIEEYLREQADMLYGKYVRKQGGEYIVSHELVQEREILQSYVIMAVLEQAAGQRKDLTLAHIEAVAGLFHGRTGASVSLVCGLTARQVYGDVHIRKETVRSKKLLELEFTVFPYENHQIPEKTYTKWFDYDKIKSSLEIRHRRSGDYFTVNEAGGTKKLKDYFIDCKIPREERETITLLAEGSHILWIVGYRISGYYKVTSQTKQILKVHVKGAEENG